ncbi:DUF6893 family small protein [Streptomyces avermitilis]
MKKTIICGVAGAVLAALVRLALPDVRRYVRIRRM